MSRIAKECQGVFTEPPSSIQAADGSKLDVRDSSQVGGDDNSWIIAGANQKVVSSGRVTLKEGATGLALPNAVFEADGGSVSFVSKGAEIKAKAGATIYADTEAKVDADSGATVKRIPDLRCRLDDLEEHKDE
jgi:hypothetical protein